MAPIINGDGTNNVFSVDPVVNPEDRQYVAGDTLVGAAGDDEYNIEAADATTTITELDGEGTDVINSESNFDMSVRAAFVENLNLDGLATIGTGNDSDNVITGLSNAVSYTLSGGAGNDELVGNDLADTLNGGDGNDIVDGGAGDDTLIGGAGDDNLDGELGDDTMIGGTGNDTYYIDSADDVVIELANEGTADKVISAIDIGTPVFDNVENIDLIGASANTAYGNALDNIIRGMETNEQYILVGGDGNDTLHGNDMADTLNGGTGADTMIGGDGDDTYVVDNVGDVILTDAGGVDVVRTSVNFSIGTTTVERVVATANNLTLTGDANANVLTGFDSRASRTTLNGGDGNDTYYVSSKTDLINETNGTDTVFIGWATNAITRTELQAQYAGVEHFFITPGSNSNAAIVDEVGDRTDNGGVIGGALVGSQTIDGGTSRGSTLSGGDGDDTYVIRNATQEVLETTGNDTVISSLARVDLTTNTKLAGVENVTLSGRARFATGRDGEVNILNGNDGANVLDGKTGADIMTGFKGNDIQGNADANTIDGGAGNDHISGGDNNDTLWGGAGDDEIEGGNGNDIIYGGLGNDILWGDAGNDTFVITKRGGVDTIKDFVRGDDIINLADVLSAYRPADHVIADFVKFDVQGGNTHVQVDANGAAGGARWVTVAIVEGVNNIDITDVTHLAL